MSTSSEKRTLRTEVLVAVWGAFVDKSRGAEGSILSFWTAGEAVWTVLS